MTSSFDVVWTFGSRSLLTRCQLLADGHHLAVCGPADSAPLRLCGRRSGCAMPLSRIYHTQKQNYRVLESQPPHKIVNLKSSNKSSNIKLTILFEMALFQSGCPDNFWTENSKVDNPQVDNLKLTNYSRVDSEGVRQKFVAGITSNEPTPYTLHPSLYTLHHHPTPYTLHPTPYTLYPSLYTLHP